MAMQRTISEGELAQHKSLEDLWIAVNGTVYDITEFAPDHPGGLEIILRFAGEDATEAYSEIHSPSLIVNGLPAAKHVGHFTGTSTKKTALRDHGIPKSQRKQAKEKKPPLSSIINSYDFEQVAAATFSQKAWAFYSSAATDLISRDNNKNAFNRIGFRPRVLRDVTPISTKSRLLGCDSDVPIFIAPIGMARLAFPDGEKAFAQGAVASGIIKCISTVASYSAAEIIDSVPRTQPFFFQLYVNRDREASRKILREVQDLGVRAIFLTVDASVPGKREADERVRSNERLVSPIASSTMKNDSKGGGIARVMGSFIDTNVTWSDIAWLRSCTSLPIVIKGIQTAADARLAMQHKVNGIVISNHGGRNLDGSPATILVLLELQRCCPEVFDAMEVYLDGGIRRGTDIVKALALGATGVALGRPFVYALSYGAKGVEKLVDILKDEMETTMRLLGVTSIEELHPGLLNTADVDHLVSVKDGHPYAHWSRMGKLGQRRAEAKL